MMSGSMPCASKRADHADMGKAARAAAAERKPDGRPHGCALGRVRRVAVGAAVPVAPAALTLENQMLSLRRRDDHAGPAGIQGNRAVMVKACRSAVTQMRRCSTRVLT